MCPALENPATSCPAVSASVSGRQRNSARLPRNGSAAWSGSSAGRPRACKTAICTTTPLPTTTAKIRKARAYVENWKEAYKNNTGLLLFGDVGTGKSFFAGCIANALLDRDVPVLMTNFPTILNRLTGMFSEDRADFIASFDEYDLLIIDDLGVERSTEYAMEQMFFVIDSRYRSRRPMIAAVGP